MKEKAETSLHNYERKEQDGGISFTRDQDEL